MGTDDGVQRILTTSDNSISTDSQPAMTPAQEFNPAHVAVTKHERSLLSYLALGMTRLEMQLHTGIPEDTIKSQLRVVYRKLRVKNAPQAVGVGLTFGIINRHAMIHAYTVQLNRPKSVENVSD